jgi:hypothetical protein
VVTAGLLDGLNQVVQTFFFPRAKNNFRLDSTTKKSIMTLFLKTNSQFLLPLTAND